MELGTQLIFLVIFGLVGFFTAKIWGFNPYKFFADGGAFITGMVLMFLFFPMITNPQDMNGNMERFTNFLVNFLPGAIIGDLAGSIVAGITGAENE